VFVDYQGRRKAKRVGPGKEGKRAALAAAEQIAARLALGNLSCFDPPAATEAPTVPTLAQLADAWLTQDVPLRCKAATLRQYQLALRAHWLPRFGDLRVIDISRDDVRAALVALGATLSRTTIRYSELPVLKGPLSYAVERGDLVASPAARVGRHVQGDRLPQERLDPFSREELGAILTTAAREFPEWYPPILTAARTGLRFGEWSALQPDDADFRGGAILVQRALSLGKLSTPKSGKGRRVDLSRGLAAVLQDWLTLQGAEAAIKGRSPAPWLFPGPDGGPVSHRYFRIAVWRPLLRRAGVRHRPPHQLRHTFASLLIQQGESLAYVRDQLGHHSIKLTVDVYGHLVPGANRQAVDRLDDIGPTRVPLGPIAQPAATPAQPGSGRRRQTAVVARG
jgi:integrase